MAQPELIEEFSPIVDPIEKKDIIVQYDFFESTSLALLKAELKDLKDRQDKARKGWFARHNAMVKMFIELKMEFDEVKKCQKMKQP